MCVYGRLEILELAEEFKIPVFDFLIGASLDFYVERFPIFHEVVPFFVVLPFSFEWTPNRGLEIQWLPLLGC